MPKVKLPKVMFFDDYHDGYLFHDYLKKIIPRVKSHEIDDPFDDGWIGYKFIFYMKKDKEYKKLLQKHLKNPGLFE